MPEEDAVKRETVRARLARQALEHRVTKGHMMRIAAILASVDARRGEATFFGQPRKASRRDTITEDELAEIAALCGGEE